MNNIKETLIISTYLYDDTKREYVLIDDFDEKLDDSNYLDGYIKLKIGKITLSDEQLYDDIDTLWLYWINGIKSIITNESFKCYYPDQPVKIEIIPIDKNTLKVCVKEQCASVNKDQFIKSMSSNAIIFFEKLKKVVPAEAYLWQQNISDVKKILKAYD